MTLVRADCLAYTKRTRLRPNGGASLIETPMRFTRTSRSEWAGRPTRTSVPPVGIVALARTSWGMMERMTTREGPTGIDGRRLWSTVMRPGEIGPGQAEHAELDCAVPGVNVLLHAVLARANR